MSSYCSPNIQPAPSAPSAASLSFAVLQMASAAATNAACASAGLRGGRALVRRMR